MNGANLNWDQLPEAVVDAFNERLYGKNDRNGNTWGRRLLGVVLWDPPLNLDEKDKPDLQAEGRL